MRDPGEALEDYWPNWSLRPGITRASLVLEVRSSSTKPRTLTLSPNLYQAPYPNPQP